MVAPAESSRERAGGWRLGQTSSEYLRSAAEQPIEWYPWGAEPFELAKRTNRPVLLDIGASWCHWCHVMDEGTYADPEVARLLKQHFIAVKVDRDENPEIDRRFQRQVGALTGEGGWPLTAFVTPQGEVFLGGTYFPPQDGLGRPGFRRVLKEVARLWKEEPGKIEQTTQQMRAALGRMSARTVQSATQRGHTAFVSSTRAELHPSQDPVNGGFGMAPKFPHPNAIAFLLYTSSVTGNSDDADHARLSLQRMADGGMYDQVGGGFHRYTTDEGWHIPHFEKMTVDNAALLDAYVEGARRFGDARFDEVIDGTAAWLSDVLGDAKGGFGASQDADNAPGDDGSYFTWSRPELKSALAADDLRLVTRFFGVGTDGRMPHDPDRNVLYRLMSLTEAADGGPFDAAAAAHHLSQSISTLRAVRARRPTPKIDRALYASLNGGVIRALAHAGAYRGDSRLLALARASADRFLSVAYDPTRGVAHKIDTDGGHGFGLLEDQAEFALGLVELAGVTLERRYLEASERLLGIIDTEFRAEDGLLRDLAPRLYDGPKLGPVDAPSYPLEDAPHLSANAATALALLRYASLTGRETYREKAGALLTAMEGRLAGAGLFATGAALAAGLWESPAARVVVEGSGKEADALLVAARRSYHPNVWVFAGLPPSPFSSPEELAAAAGATTPRALVCFGTRCLAPIAEPAQLREALLSGGRSAAA
jgi:uncharacterized protein